MLVAFQLAHAVRLTIVAHDAATTGQLTCQGQGLGLRSKWLLVCRLAAVIALESGCHIVVVVVATASCRPSVAVDATTMLTTRTFAAELRQLYVVILASAAKETPLLQLFDNVVLFVVRQTPTVNDGQRRRGLGFGFAGRQTLLRIQMGGHFTHHALAKGWQ